MDVWPVAVSVWCQLPCKASVARPQRQRSATVMGLRMLLFTPKNAVLGVVRSVSDVECLLDTQEVTGSSPVSPIPRKSFHINTLRRIRTSQIRANRHLVSEMCLPDVFQLEGRVVQQRNAENRRRPNKDTLRGVRSNGSQVSDSRAQSAAADLANVSGQSSDRHRCHQPLHRRNGPVDQHICSIIR